MDLIRPIAVQKAVTNNSYKICVVGAGHVGLVTAVCFAELGYKVICIDNDENKIRALKRKILPFYEPGLKPLVVKNLKAGNLTFSFLLKESILKSEVIFIVVGTPPLADGSADLAAVENIARLIAENLNSYKLIVEKSTVPVQTGQKVKETIYRYRKHNVEFDVASNPEFLREGKAVYDFFHPDRIVIGVESKRAELILKKLYSSIKAPLVTADINTSELIKHASNSFLSTKISFINAVARVCDLSGADIKKVSEAMGLDKRIGKDFLNAGIGYGGFCFPKDLEAFIYISKKLGYDFGLLREVKKINEEQRAYFMGKIKEHLWVMKGKKIAILGLSFKPDTDDMRFAPSVDIVKSLLKEGANLSLYDPQAIKQAKEIFSAEGAALAHAQGSALGGKDKRIKFSKSPYEAAKNSDCICFLTEWKEFYSLDLKRIKKVMHYPLIADGRNIFDKNKLTQLGFKYIGIGV
ncbi:MAG: UDP-glucose/GDP-mannose dehydrogenase family protein [Candidatus Omnitrophota bacterium]|nr:UDP-glucose/GDP-mannose dehydrogenase family protein [Candidatus Omnitrophota bacterium]